MKVPDVTLEIRIQLQVISDRLEFPRNWPNTVSVLVIGVPEHSEEF